MNKTKKSDPKKILVRNTELSIPKTKLKIGEQREKAKKKPESETKKEPQPESQFRSPELHSTLNIIKKIDKIEKTKSEIFQKKPDVAFCEKVTRKINFPSDKSIYKDLIPLCVPAKSPPVLSSRSPLPQKDKEPVLSDYIKPWQSKEFIYYPKIKLEKKSLKPPQIDHLRLYKIIQIHKQ